MDLGNNRAEILAAGRSLFTRDPDRFTVASLCRESGFSRAKIRRHFPTKRALISCLAERITQEPDRDSMPVIDAPLDAWDNLSQDVPEGNAGLLPVQADGLASAPPVAAVETDWPAPTITASYAAELPPIVTGAFAHPAPDNRALPDPWSQTNPLAPDIDPPRRDPFQAREKVQQILASAQKTENKPGTVKQRSWMTETSRLTAAAALTVAVLMAGAALVSLGGLTRSKQAPMAPLQRIAAPSREILVIDATGAAPDPMYQEAPPALRDVIARARRGDTKAQVELAQSFLRGQGINADPVAAARWSDEAAAQGDPTAQFIMGSLYAEGIKANPRLAFDWFAAAAARGNIKAMHNLAIAYLNGSGVNANAQMAAAWFAKAANAGYRDSAFDLGVLYERGEGVAQSGPDALKWYDRAAALGDTEAKQRAGYLRSQLWQVSDRASPPPS